MPQAEPQHAAQLVAQIVQRLESIVVDQAQAVRLTLLAVACGGHVLFEDVPGVGKTTLVRSLAQVLGLDFHRVQGTPDRLPAEIVGSSMWDNRESTFRFVPGPIFGQCVLFDELNRAPAKTQAALLEAMEEGQVTVDGVAHPLPRPFVVLATQNPIELEGTFPLPEAALDRFFVRVHMGYPSLEGELRLMRSWAAPAWRMDLHANQSALSPLTDAAGIFMLRQAVARVFVSPEMEQYILALVHATRGNETQAHPDIALGLSPRAGLAIRQAAQAWALFNGVEHVRPDDVQAIFVPCSAHRVMLHPSADLRGKTAEAILTELLTQVPVTGSWATMTTRAAVAGASLGAYPGGSH